MRSVRQAVGWGYTFIKHDFSTYELFGRWGSDMHAQVTSPGAGIFTTGRGQMPRLCTTSCEAIRAAAGDQTTILGCNTVGHIAAPESSSHNALETIQAAMTGNVRDGMV